MSDKAIITCGHGRIDDPNRSLFVTISEMVIAAS